MKIKRIVAILALTLSVCCLCTINCLALESVSLKRYCTDNHISYILVRTVGDYCSTMSDREIAEYFVECASLADTDAFVEPVDAISSMLNCSFEEALTILEESDSRS